jgi:creatinine amidohydrolase/Fe(II)-dependent formamide hydrolase-like protein
MLEDVGSSMKVHGFEHIIYIGDSGGNQRGMKNVAERLNQRWGQQIALFIPEFYDNQAVIDYMNNELGIKEPIDEGLHDYYWASAMQMVTDPATLRYDQRVKAGKATINGISIAPKEKTIEVGKKLMKLRIDATARAIRERTK